MLPRIEAIVSSLSAARALSAAAAAARLFVIYHGKAHGLRGPRHVPDLLDRKIEWLECWAGSQKATPRSDPLEREMENSGWIADIF